MLNLAMIFPIMIGKTALDFEATEATAQLDSPLDQPQLGELRGQIESYLEEYTQRAGLDTVEITASELKTVARGAQILRNRQPNSVLTGCVVINMPSDCDLEFWDPNNGLRMLEQPPRQRRLKAQAKNQDLIIWPSWLEHEIHENTSEETVQIIVWTTKYKSEPQ
jgi:hypothetical protein